MNTLNFHLITFKNVCEVNPNAQHIRNNYEKYISI